MENKEYDLEERLEKFGEKIIELAKKVPRNPITIPILSQLVRSGTSMGGNYMEANGASSKKDFKNKIHICKKETMETKHWLRMLAKAYEPVREECRELWQESQEYTKIFSRIITTLKGPKKNV
jgi:four helix bundle protein